MSIEYAYKDDIALNASNDTKSKELKIDKIIEEKEFVEMESVNSESASMICLVTAYKVLCLLPISIAAVVIFVGLKVNAENLSCNYLSIDTAISNGSSCPSNPTNVFLGIHRLAISAVCVIIVIVCTTSSGPSVIGYQEVSEMMKFARMSLMCGLAGKYGMLSAVHFLLTFFSVTIVFVEKLPVRNMPIALPSFLFYGATAICSSFFFLFLYWIVNAECTKQYFEITDLVIPDYMVQSRKCCFEVKKQDSRGESTLPCKNSLLVVLWFLYCGLCLTALIFVLKDISAQEELKFATTFLRVVSSLISIGKHIFFILQVIQFPHTVAENLLMHAITGYFELYFLLEMAVSMPEPLLISAIVFSWLLNLYCFVYLAIEGKLKAIKTSIKEKWKDLLFRQHSVVYLTTLSTCVACAIVLVSFVKRFFESNVFDDAANYSISWCASIINDSEVTDSLTSFYPGKSSVIYAEIITMMMNIEPQLILIGLSLVNLFGFRLSGYMNLFWTVDIWALFLSSLVMLRIDSFQDGMEKLGDMGYAYLGSNHDSVRVMVESRCCVVILLWVLVAYSLTDHERQNIRSYEFQEKPESRNAENLIDQPIPDELKLVNDGEEISEDELEMEKDWFNCSKTFVYVVVFVALFFTFLSWQGNFSELKMKDFANYGEENSIGAAIPGTPIESTDPTKWQCTESSENDTELDNFNSALWRLVYKCDKFQEQNKFIREIINQKPFNDWTDKFPLYIPLFGAALFALYADLFGMNSTTYNRIAILLIIVTIFNLFYFLGMLFSVYIFSLQLVYYFLDVIIQNGFFYFLIATFFTCVYLGMIWIDQNAKMMEPEN